MSIGQFNIRKYKINFNYLIALSFGLFAVLASVPFLARVIKSQSVNAEPPIITSVTPNEGPVSGGNKVIIEGSSCEVPVELIQVSAGQDHTCAVGSDGSAYCWGDSFNGELGDGSNVSSLAPVAVTMPVDVAFEEVSSGTSHTCAIGTDSNAYCWGGNSDGQLGDGTNTGKNTPTAVTMPVGVQFTDISVGYYHTCAIGTDSNAYCWGYNFDGQLGDGTTINKNIPTLVSNLAGETFVDVVAGGNHSCAMNSLGNAYCWGDDRDSQLGDGGIDADKTTPTLVSMPVGVTFSHITTGNYHTCAVGSDNKGYCWGYNGDGQLGDGTNADKGVPTLISTPVGVDLEKVTAGYYFTCALDSIGRAYCWGYNFDGELGDGTNADTNLPAAVLMPEGVTFNEIETGVYHTCAIGSDSNTYCWGLNDDYELTDVINASEPTLVLQGDLPIGQIYEEVVSGDNHTCALDSTGKAYCWGYDITGQLGDGGVNLNKRVATSVIMPIGVTFTQIVAGEYHTCALGSDSNAYCWGYNTKGQLGDGTNVSKTIPTLVSMPVGVTFTQISASLSNTCAVGSDGNAYCWGLDSYGQLGDGGANLATNIPTLVSMPIGVTFSQIAVGSLHSCALGSDSKAYCWGRDSFGQVGDGGGFINVNVPTQVAMPVGVVFSKLALGYSHSCAISVDNDGYCWGRDNYGQLGDSLASANLDSPALVLMPAGVKINDVSAGYDHTCAIDIIGKPYCWGNDYNYALGDDKLVANQFTPVPVNSTDLFKKITTGLWDTCALNLDGKVYCWGNSSYGKLGSYVPDGSFPAPILKGEIPQGIEVKFNDTVVTCSPLTSTSFEITVPAHAPGYADVSIANAFGEITTLVDGYLYVDSTEPTDPADPTPTEDSAATPAAPATGIGKVVSLEVIVLALVSFAIGAVGLTRRKIA